LAAFHFLIFDAIGTNLLSEVNPEASILSVVRTMR